MVNTVLFKGVNKHMNKKKKDEVIIRKVIRKSKSLKMRFSIANALNECARRNN